MNRSALLIGNDRIQVDVFHTAENPSGNLGVFFGEVVNQPLDFRTLRAFLRSAAGGTAFRQAAGALDKVQVVIIPPAEDVLLPDEVQGANQLHAGEIRAVEFGHHGLNLAAIKHSHENGFNHIVIVVSQCNFVTAQLPGFAIEIPPAHSGAQIAGGAALIGHDVKNLRVEHFDGDTQKPCIVQHRLGIQLVIARIHHQVNHLKILPAMGLQLLKELCHEHGILAAGNADRNFISI